MKKLATILIAVSLVSCAGLQKSVITEKHFKYHVKDGLERKTVEHLNWYLEKNYARILEDFSVKKMPVVPLWIWQSKDAFLDMQEIEMHRRLPSVQAYSNITGIRLNYIGESTLPLVLHEFVHVVHLYHMNNQMKDTPLWLVESLAVFESTSVFDPKRAPGLPSGDYPTIKELNDDISKNLEIYSYGYTIIEFVIDQWGRDKLSDLIDAYGDTQKSYGVSISEFEAMWHTFLDKKYRS